MLTKSNFCLANSTMFTVRCIRLKHYVKPIRHQRNLQFSRTVRYLFKEQLLITNSITSGMFLGLGDLINQEMEYQKKALRQRYDWIRLGRMFFVGASMGYLHHHYYLYLDKLMPKASLKVAFIKVAADQAICSPLTILFFFYSLGMLEAKSLEEITKELKAKFKFVYLGDWLFWPPIQLFNFYYLPTEYRVFFINFATMIFDVFLSYMKHSFH